MAADSLRTEGISFLLVMVSVIIGLLGISLVIRKQKNKTNKSMVVISTESPTQQSHPDPPAGDQIHLMKENIDHNKYSEDHQDAPKSVDSSEESAKLDDAQSVSPKIADHSSASDECTRTKSIKSEESFHSDHSETEAISAVSNDKMKCKFFNCSCTQYVASTSKWTVNQCSRCNHPKSKHVLIHNDVDTRNISRRGSVCRAYEILWRYQGHSYTLSTAAGSYLVDDLRRHIIDKLKVDGNEQESQIIFKLNGKMVTDFKMDIVAYFKTKNVSTITFDVIPTDCGPGIVRTGRWSAERSEL